jgi:hypothetical protein
VALAGLQENLLTSTGGCPDLPMGRNLLTYGLELCCLMVKFGSLLFGFQLEKEGWSV